MRKRLVLSGIIALLLVAVMAIGVVGSGALFSDTETSNQNTYTAGTLDLQLDGKNGENVVKFTVGDYKPVSGPKAYVFKLENLGSLPGFIDLHDIAVTSHENTVLEPEIVAGDISDPADPDYGVGELDKVMGMHMFVDEAPSNGSFGGEDTTIYGGAYKQVAGIATEYPDLNLAIAAGGTKYITIQIGWWNPNHSGGLIPDNQAMGDSFDFGMTFELAQTAAQ